MPDKEPDGVEMADWWESYEERAMRAHYEATRPRWMKWGGAVLRALRLRRPR